MIDKKNKKMLIGLLCAVLLPVAVSQSAPAGDLRMKGSYILPRYPELAYRARVEGFFAVEILAEGGKVASIAFVSQKASSPTMGEREASGQVFDVFAEAIKEAVNQWQFREQTREKFELTIRFRFKPYSALSDNYITYKVLHAPLSDRPIAEILVESPPPPIQTSKLAH